MPTLHYYAPADWDQLQYEPNRAGVQQFRTCVHRTDAVYAADNGVIAVCYADCDKRERRDQVPANLGR